MREKNRTAGFLVGLLLGVSLAAGAADNYKLVNGTEDFYYGHISLVDIRNDGHDPMVLREGATSAEPAILNLPLGPGDTIFTSGERRCEIQLDNGTILRLDTNTTLKIEALMAQSLSARTKVSNLALRRGRAYVMYKQYGSKEMFQVITANAAVKLAHGSVSTVGWTAEAGTEIGVDYGRVSVLYGPAAQNLAVKTVSKSEAMVVAPNHAASFPKAGPPSDFAGWNLRINKAFDELHKGKAMIPKPIEMAFASMGLTAQTFQFAQQYGSLFGEWIYDSYFGYVWRPFANDMRFTQGGWAPYKIGRWTSYNGQMFWVPEEPWGWIPSHLGVWHWDANRGWYWLPGSVFAPAWVDWASFGGTFFGWRPWSLWDWGWDNDYYASGLFGGYGPSGPLYQRDWRMPGFLTSSGYTMFYSSGIVRDYHGEGDRIGPMGGSTPKNGGLRQIPLTGTAAFAMPKEFQRGLTSLSEGLKKGDETVLGSLQFAARLGSIVKGSDLGLGGLQDRAVSLDSFLAAAASLPSNSPQNIILGLAAPSARASAEVASRTFVRGVQLAAFLAGPSVRESYVDGSFGAAPAAGSGSRAPAGSPRQPEIRARDWNPDVRIGIKSGLSIVYLSGRNEIAVPELRLDSSMVRGRGPVLASDGQIQLSSRSLQSAGDGYFSRATYSSGGSYGMSYGSSSGGSVSTAAGSGGGSSSGGGGGGGHIKD